MAIENNPDYQSGYQKGGGYGSYANNAGSTHGLPTTVGNAREGRGDDVLQATQLLRVRL